MTIEDCQISIKINGKNRKQYSKITNDNLSTGDTITISQLNVIKGSRVEVSCSCDYCKTKFYRQIYAIRGNNTFCSLNCKNKWLKNNNPNPKKDEKKVFCEVCHKEFFVYESKYLKQDNFLCSRGCYSTHRKINYRADNIYNYSRFNVNCNMCNITFETTEWYIENKRFLFCSQECYWRHRKEFYKDYYYKTNINNSRTETDPEKTVRRWLESNDIKYVQEYPFYKKYFIDFFLPEHKVAIEVNGDYWHANPTIYGDGDNLKPLHKNQLGVHEYDEKRNTEIRQHFPLFVIWESQIKQNVDFFMSKIISNILIENP
ncbi:PDDEXK family nuclease [Oceanobacillus kimchii]|uniref:TRASH domain-containing protein n=1 Tax=Oceanobacillus kimchii TaxID=746691 RepID=A0ABQ5TGX9_9BACI|nr:hypothetical protein [Oceanobacillus kimchii]GLO66126.1 hypothetical protein MACH08_19100 [Oceanobacillus kimchii]